MPDPYLSENPLKILRVRLASGVKATPLCIAVIGWLCNDPTDPFIAAIQLQGAQVFLRLSDESALEPACSLIDFLHQVKVICQFFEFDSAQTRYVVERVRQMLE